MACMAHIYGDPVWIRYTGNKTNMGLLPAAYPGQLWNGLGRIESWDDLVALLELYRMMGSSDLFVIVHLVSPLRSAVNMIAMS